MATIREHARYHPRILSLPFSRMVAVNKQKTLIKIGDTETDMARRYALAAIQMVDLSHAEAQRTRRTLVALALAIRTEARAKRLAFVRFVRSVCKLIVEG